MKTELCALALLIVLGGACGEGSQAPSPDVLAGDTPAGPDMAVLGEETTTPARIDPALRPEDLVLPPVADPEAPSLPAGIRLRVASYNIYGGRFADVATISAFLDSLALDVLAIQECPGDFVAPLAEATGLAHTAGTSGAVLFSRHPLRESAELALPLGRGLVRGVAEIGGVPFSLYAVHISWDAAGDVQTRAMVDEHLAADPNPHLVMLGDFNDEHYSTQITILEEVLADAFTDFGWYPGERISWPATEFGGSEGAQLIDLVFYRRDFRPLVLDAQVLNLRPVLSDHKPVVAELLYPPDPAQPFAQDPFAPLRDPWRGWPPENERPDNLLANPGAEEGLVGWQVVGGMQVESARAAMLPLQGAAFFAGPPERTLGEGRWSSATQEVDLVARAGADPAALEAGRGRLYASGYFRVGYRVEEEHGVASNILGPNNHGEILVELLDAAGETLLRHSSGQRDTYAYHPYAEIIDLPPGTRHARYTLLCHQHPWYLGGCEVAFDELYLGYEERPAVSAVLGGNLLVNGGAETGDFGGWNEGPEGGWWNLPELSVHGFMELPPLSWSGRNLWFGGGILYMQEGKEGLSTLSQDLDLSPWRDVQQDGGLALRWGGWARTWKAGTELSLALEILDTDGSVWGTVAAPPVFAAEWSQVESLTRIPPHAAGARLVLSAEVTDPATGVFADELFVRPELAPSLLSDR